MLVCANPPMMTNAQDNHSMRNNPLPLKVIRISFILVSRKADYLVHRRHFIEWHIRSQEAGEGDNSL